jgi:hypothetical protein
VGGARGAPAYGLDAGCDAIGTLSLGEEVLHLAERGGDASGVRLAAGLGEGSSER